jgi:hypothetical protein
MLENLHLFLLFTKYLSSLENLSNNFVSLFCMRQMNLCLIEKGGNEAVSEFEQGTSVYGISALYSLFIVSVGRKVEKVPFIVTQKVTTILFDIADQKD